jgi:hypothetical protein
MESRNCIPPVTNDFEHDFIILSKTPPNNSKNQAYQPIKSNLEKKRQKKLKISFIQNGKKYSIIL